MLQALYLYMAFINTLAYFTSARIKAHLFITYECAQQARLFVTFKAFIDECNVTL